MTPPASPPPTCPACGSPIDESAVFCATCGLLLAAGERSRATAQADGNSDPAPIPPPPPAGPLTRPAVPPPPAGPLTEADLPPTTTMTPVGPPTEIMPTPQWDGGAASDRPSSRPPWWLLGVAALLLVAIVAGIVAIANTGDDDTSDDTLPSTVPPSSTPAAPATTAATPTSVSSSTSTAPTSTTATTSVAPTTTAPPTTAGLTTTLAPGAVPGDLGLAGRPMRKPACDGSFITVLASAVGVETAKVGVPQALDEFGGNYLRTDQACSSLRQSVDGNPIYVVYHGPFVTSDEACAARAVGHGDAYVRQLSSTAGSDHIVNCD